MFTDDAISPAHLAAARAVFKSLNGRLTSKLGAKWEPSSGAHAVTRVFDFFRDNLAGLGDQAFGMRIDLASQGSTAMSAGFIRDEMMKWDGALLFTVDGELRCVGIDQLPCATDYQTAMDQMQDASVDWPVFYFEHRDCVRVFAKGGMVDDVAPASGEKAGRHGRFSRSSLSYREAIREHYEECVKHATNCDHWEKAKERILRKRLGVATKTEEIFQHSLMHWLKLVLTDATVWPEPRKPNKDRADIKIEVFGGNFYLIEIKWLGSSGGTTKRKIDRLRDGIKQLRQYLEQPPCPKHAALVVYDGRDKAEFDGLVAIESSVEGIKHLNECGNAKVPDGGCCTVFFLFSKRASEL